MQEHKFDKAKPTFRKSSAGLQQGIGGPRANVHLSICNQHLERTTATQFKTSGGAFRLRRLADDQMSVTTLRRGSIWKNSSSKMAKPIT